MRRVALPAPRCVALAGMPPPPYQRLLPVLADVVLPSSFAGSGDLLDSAHAGAYINGLRSAVI